MLYKICQILFFSVSLCVSPSKNPKGGKGEPMRIHTPRHTENYRCNLCLELLCQTVSNVLGKFDENTSKWKKLRNFISSKKKEYQMLKLLEEINSGSSHHLSPISQKESITGF